MSSLPVIDEAAQQRVVDALEERARLLRPDEGLIESALRRCLGQVSLEEAVEAGLPVGQPPPVTESGSSSAPVLNDPAQVATELGGNQIRDAQVFRRGHDERRGQVLESGIEIAGYRVEAMIGKGGMGQVYRALQLSVNRHVALKVLSPRLARNPSLRSRFLREARNAGRLQHPHLIGVHDVGELDGLLFFSMELVDGRSVRELLKQDGPFEEKRAREIIGEVLDALTFAHGHGLIHRDIKPDNIMITDEGVVKVADLGLSRSSVRSAHEEGETTRSGSVMGTPYYMPPEQGRDASNVDHRADIYAVGATLYHMVCGRVPFSGRTPVDVLVRASTQALTFPEDGPSTELRRIIARLMAKDPTARPASAEEAQSLVLGKHLVLQHSAQLFGKRSGYQRARRHTGGRLLPLLASLLMLAAMATAAGWGAMWYLEGRAISHLEQRFHFLCEQNRFMDAQEVLTADQGRGSRYEPVIAVLEGELQQRWRSHLQTVWSQDLIDIENSRASGDYAAAHARLDALATEDAPPFAQDFLFAQREQVHHDEVLSWVSDIRFEPQAVVTVQGAGQYLLQGQGTGSLPVLATMPVGGAVRIRISIDGRGSLSFDQVVGNREWHYRTDQARLQVFDSPRVGGRDRRRPYDRHHGGRAVFELRRHDDTVVMVIPGSTVQGLAIPWPHHEEGFSFQWDIERGTARMEFEPANQPNDNR